MTDVSLDKPLVVTTYTPGDPHDLYQLIRLQLSSISHFENNNTINNLQKLLACSLQEESVGSQ